MRKPNIVFIICDDLGINDLHCYGRRGHCTPNLDALAAQGVRFTSAYCSQPICSASRAGLLTGLNPARLHLTTFLPGRPDCAAQKMLHPEIMLYVPLSVKTLPCYFKAHGYVTGLVGKWHIGGTGYGPREHGFDFFADAPHNTVPSATEGGKAEYHITRETIRFIEANRDRPFVVYVGHHTPHIPYTAREQLIAKHQGAFEPVYAALIETLDDSVGLILKKLDELNLTDDTIVVFTSDNGGLHVPESRHVRVTHNTPFRAGKGFVYEGGLRVPQLVRWPKHVPANVVTDTPVMNTDWIPTLMELAGLPPPAGLDGISFAKGLTAGAFEPRPMFWHFPHYTNQGSRPSGAARDGNWLLVEYYDAEQAELYDLTDDVSETNDVAAQHPDRVRAMRRALDAWRRDNDVQYVRPNPDCSAAKYRELYVDVDASRFDPRAATPADWDKIKAWRAAMNAVVRDSM